MPAPELVTMRDQIAWSYGTLAAAQVALQDGRVKHKSTDWMIRAKLFAGLRTGSMRMRSLLDDEREALNEEPACVHCGEIGRITLDHLLPRARGGLDAHNLVRARRSCNSSKGDRDLLVWHESRGTFPRLAVLRRYLKLVALLCDEADVLDLRRDHPDVAALSFDAASLPVRFRPLAELRL